ncbi:hypothetical protein CO172_02265 [Candidatus Uhrbacteria bacterium CG_4_9_14_3_um_filter_36_7]|uniref:Uncharacterized protein n=1 Tax=Candidatus Uhrbacteria bacterium CG_4_9_14_3_um_filter_36_7 TaxID=1975033 RepID=A0A2M7XHE2_9BACT|nr:MAG: hypothetical protein CO172_02265 [Candidatus Uhrbacteria bacterium CG_4_9_14_3_um_filter_36_7]
MSKTPNYDAKAKAILDATKPGERVCELTGEKWFMDEREIEWYRKFNVPPSRYSPLTRMRLLTNTFSGGQWWYNQHAQTGKPIICGIHPGTGIRVLPDKEWFEKDFSFEQIDYDESRSVFDQIYELNLRIPSSAQRNYVEVENSISIASHGDQNSYFVVASKSKNTLFGVVAYNTEDSAEIYNAVTVNQSYNIVNSNRIFQSRYVRESNDCLNSVFLFDCRNCEYCFGATNKRNKKHLWFNEQLSKDEWEKRRAQVDLGKRSVVEEYLQKFDELMIKSIWPENFNEKTTDSIGEYLHGCTDCQYVYFADGGARHCDWCVWAIAQSQDNAFCAEVVNSKDCYYSAGVPNCYGGLFLFWCVRCQNSELCIGCYDCENCFGCVGLLKKKFHFFNKPYTEKEYWQKVDQIKCTMFDRGEYGEFFPAKFSFGHYLESGAVKYHLADLAFGEKIHANLFPVEIKGATGAELAQAMDVKDSKEIPDTIDEIDAWVNKPVYDAKLKRRFSLIAPEIALYKKLRIAPPVEHHIARVIDMIFSSNSAVFDEARCEKCNKHLRPFTSGGLKRRFFCLVKLK